MSEQQADHSEFPTAPEARCLNCDAILIGPYCARCGQHVKHHVRSTWATVREFVEDLFHAENKVWRTLVPLAFRPGLLTVEYLRGRRASYASPFKLYIVLSLIFFVLASIGGDEQGPALQLTLSPEQAASAVQETLDADTLATLDRMLSRLPVEQRAAARERMLAQLAERQPPAAGTPTDPCDPRVLAESLPAGLGANARILEICRRVAAEDESFQRALADNVPTMMFFFLPLIALGGKALYLGSRRYYAEHLLFFIHFHSFFFLIVGAGIGVRTLLAPVATTAPLNLLNAAVAVYIPVYLYRAMRRVYGQSRFVTIVKFTLLLVAYFVSLLMTLLFLIAFTALSM